MKPENFLKIVNDSDHKRNLIATRFPVIERLKLKTDKLCLFLKTPFPYPIALHNHSGPKKINIAIEPGFVSLELSKTELVSTSLVLTLPQVCVLKKFQSGACYLSDPNNDKLATHYKTWNFLPSTNILKRVYPILALDQSGQFISDQYQQLPFFIHYYILSPWDQFPSPNNKCHTPVLAVGSCFTHQPDNSILN